VAGLRDILDEMADQIRTVLETANEVDVQVEPRMVFQAAPLTVDMYPGDPSRFAESRAMDDDGGYRITVRTRTSTPDHDATYDLLVATMDDEDELCVPLALIAEPTLNGMATSLDVTNATGLRLYETPDPSMAHLGWQFTAVVLPAKS
jgi:hypothetical protein